MTDSTRQQTQKLPYHGITERGRETRAASLHEAIDDLAFISNIPTASVITMTLPTDGRRTYLYDDQAKLDRDSRVDEDVEPREWFAFVDDTSPRAPE